MLSPPQAPGAVSLASVSALWQIIKFNPDSLSDWSNITQQSNGRAQTRIHICPGITATPCMSEMKSAYGPETG